MKASPLPGLLAAAALSVVSGLWNHAAAQDAIVLKSGVTREGKIIGVANGNVRLQTPAGIAGTPLTEVTEVRMDAPPEFDAAAAQLAAGDAKGALAALQKLNDSFTGLPAPWAQRAAVMLGDAKLAAGDSAGARQAYEQFSRTYPQATVLANLGMARLAVDAGKFDEASKLLTPILASSAKTAFPLPSDGSTLSQGHYLMGRVKEAQGDLPGALEQYLKASAVFPFDRNAAATAQARADALRAENSGLIAP